ncbi:MAG: 23S rRNA (guanosine(2251)-2'-O)-methyltransferase RlmB [Propionibacteriaceae bacterium]
MPGNSQRKGAVKRKGKGNTAGSGGRVRRGLEGRGPTPKAEDREYHAAHKRKHDPHRNQSSASRSGTGRGGGPQRTGRPGAGPEWVAGRNPVLEALQADIPIKTAYVAEGAERDDRMRDILKLAADRGTPMLQVTRVELDRLTGGAIHQGVAVQLPDYTYAHPDDLLSEALDRSKAGTGGLVVALDQITDPRNLGAIIRSAAAFGATGVLIPERRSAQMTASAQKTSAGAAVRLPVARATNLTRALTSYADAGFTIVGLAGEGAETIDQVAADLPPGPRVLVIGSEGAGMSRLVRETCTRLVSIPISTQVESLNAGVAAGIALYELTRHEVS